MSEEPLCWKGGYLNCTGKVSTVIHGTRKNEMLAKRADGFLDRSITGHLRGVGLGGFIFMKTVDH